MRKLVPGSIASVTLIDCLTLEEHFQSAMRRLPARRRTTDSSGLLKGVAIMQVSTTWSSPWFGSAVMRSAVLLGLAVALSQGDVVAKTVREWKRDHVAELRYVTSAQISPDGEHIAYRVSVPRRPIEDGDGPAWSHLYVANVASGKRNAHSSSARFGRFAGVVARLEINLTTRLNERATMKRFFIASPSMEVNRFERCVIRPPSVALTSHRTVGVSRFCQRRDGKERKELKEKGFNQEIYEEDWQPTRVWVAEIDPDSVELERQAASENVDSEGSASEVQWSPSGQELAVVLAPTPSVDDSYMKKQVHVVEVESGRMIRSIEQRGKLGQVAWSPDGKRLALVSAIDEHDPQEGRLMVATIDGDEVAPRI